MSKKNRRFDPAAASGFVPEDAAAEEDSPDSNVSETGTENSEGALSLESSSVTDGKSTNRFSNTSPGAEPAQSDGDLNPQSAISSINPEAVGHTPETPRAIITLAERSSTPSPVLKTGRETPRIPICPNCGAKHPGRKAGERLSCINCSRPITLSS